MGGGGREHLVQVGQQLGDQWKPRQSMGAQALSFRDSVTDSIFVRKTEAVTGSGKLTQAAT